MSVFILCVRCGKPCPCGSGSVVVVKANAERLWYHKKCWYERNDRLEELVKNIDK